jgi:hypothetical protein
VLRLKPSFEIRFFFEKLRENSINKNANPMDSLAGAEDFFSGHPGELCGFGGFPSFFFGALACCLGGGEVSFPQVVQGTAPEIAEPTQCWAGTGCIGFI